MVVEHAYVKTPGSAGAAVVYCQGRVLSSAELLGLPDSAVPGLRALPLLFASWMVLALVATVPLIGLATVFAAPLLMGQRRSRSRLS